jgi:hypothetical protein
MRDRSISETECLNQMSNQIVRQHCVVYVISARCVFGERVSKLEYFFILNMPIKMAQVQLDRAQTKKLRNSFLERTFVQIRRWVILNAGLWQ